MVELSSLDVLFLARELVALEDAYVDKVYEVAPGEFLLRTRHPQRGRSALLVRPGRFACLAEEPPEAPQSPTSFAALLRKHLAGARIRRVDQREFDRVLVFHLDAHGTALRLVVELFGKGNLVVVGPDDAIRIVQRSETFRDRTLKVGEPFQFPPARVNPVRLSRAEFDALADKSERDAVRFLATDAAFGPDVAEELVHRAGVSKALRARELTESQRERIWKEWQGILHAVPQPALAERDSEARVESLPMTAPKFAGWARTTRPTLSAAIDAARRREEATAPVPRDEERERLQRQLQSQAGAIEALTKEAERWTTLANSIYERFPEAKAIHEAAAQWVRDRGWSGAEQASRSGESPPGVLRVEAEGRRVVAQVGDVQLSLDPEESLEKNASRLFDEAKQLRAKIEAARRALEETRGKLEDRTRAADAPKPKATPRPAQKRFWFESYRWFYTSEGFLAVGGRDAASNEKLVKKHLGAGDLYFHADVHGAPSCVLKSEGRKPGEASLRQVAQFAASYSKAFSQFGSADAYWVRPEQVSKTGPTGESVARGAFMVRGDRNYVPRLPMEVGVGLLRLGKDGRADAEGPWPLLMGGPPEAVSHWCALWVRVVRGDQKASDAVRDLASRFGVSHDEVQGVLPAGTLRILPAGEGPG